MFFREDNLKSSKGYARFFHAAPNAPAVDIYANDILVAKNLSFAHITDYKELSTGEYTISIFKTGDKSKILSTSKISILNNSILTVSAIILESNIETLILKDTMASTNKKLAFIRFINFSPDSGLLTLSLPNGTTLFNGVEYLETTGYYSLSAGVYDFLVESSSSPANQKYIRQLKLDENTYHTIFIIGLVDTNPRIGSFITKDGF